MDLRPLLNKLDEKTQSGKEFYVIAIDGKAGSGKTTIANELSTMLDASIIHMDDFFLLPELRTKERLEEAGGNVHYERFIEEVVKPLKKNSLKDGFSYRIFDCSKLDYNGLNYVKPSKFYIVEGSYSCHSKFLDYADLRVFIDVDERTQMQRIINRNGEEKAKQFKERWIPMEEKYFTAMQIKQKADVVIFNC